MLGALSSRNRTMNAELFNEAPFNLAGESLNAEHDAQQEANEKRVRELAEAEARKAQSEFWTCPRCKRALIHYDGCLGYEAARCEVCNFERDLHAELNGNPIEGSFN